MKNSDIKKQLRDYGMFIAVIAGLGIIAFFFTVLSRKPWNKNLQAHLETTINRSYPGQYVAGNAVFFNAGFSVSAVAFELTKPDGQRIDGTYGIIVRIATMYGALPAVFLYDAGTGTIKDKPSASFVGLAALPVRMTEQFKHAPFNSQIVFWERRLAAMQIDRYALQQNKERARHD